MLQDIPGLNRATVFTVNVQYVCKTTCHGLLTNQLTCPMMYVSSSISTALSSNRDFLFATENENNSMKNQHFGYFETQRQEC